MHENDKELRKDFKILKPRWYQDEALARLRSTRDRGINKALIVMATGLGKTAVAAFDVRDYIYGYTEPRVLFICHQYEILKHARGTFHDILGDSYNYGFFYSNKKDSLASTNFLFATFQTLGNYLGDIAPNHFDYVVVDESHHSMANTFRPVIDYLNPKFKLAITATPDRMDLLNIREIYGPEVYTLPLEKAIALNLFPKVDYKVMSADTDLEALKKLKKFKKSNLSIALLDKELFQPKPLEQVAEMIKAKLNGIPNARVVIFTPNIRTADAVADLLEGALSLHTGKKKYEEIFNRFKNGDLQIITVVDKFNEGVDIPEANVIVFLRSTNSRTIFFQQLGRGMRKSDEKKVMVLDFVGNCARIQMINELWKKVKGIRKSLDINLKNEKDKSFDIGELNFSEVTIDILKILNRNNLTFDSDSMIQGINDLANDLGRTPTKQDVDDCPYLPSSRTYEKRFGTYNNALKVAMLEPNLRVKYRSQDELLDDLKELANMCGHVPTQNDVKWAHRSGMCASLTTYGSHFGNLSKALQKAGLIKSSQDYHAQVTRAEIAAGSVPAEHAKEMIARLAMLVIDLERLPTVREINQLSKTGDIFSYDVYARVFGNFKNAIDEALKIIDKEGVYKVRTLKYWDTDEIILGLQNLTIQLGRVPVKKDIREAALEKQLPRLETITRRFGSLELALEAAGVSVK